MVLKMTELIQHVRQRLLLTKSRKKSYADKWRSELEFQVRDTVLVKVSPLIGIIRFRKKGKLGTSFISPFRVMARVGKVTHQLNLQEELNQIHNNFHILQLQKCMTEKFKIVPLDDIHVGEQLKYIERPVVILDRKMKILSNKVVDR